MLYVNHSTDTRS